MSWLPVDLLPHRDPLLLLDNCLAADHEHVVSDVTIRADSLYCRATGVPSWVGIEYMAQTIGLYSGLELLADNQPPRVGFLLGTRKYTTSISSFPIGMRILIKATALIKEEGGLSVFDCQICDALETDNILAKARIKGYLPTNVEQFMIEYA